VKLTDLRKRYSKGKRPKRTPAGSKPRATGLPGQKACRNCDGTGKVLVDGGPSGRPPREVTCSRCDGTGIAVDPDTKGPRKRHVAIEEEHPGLAGGERDGTTKKKLDLKKIAERRAKVGRAKYTLVTDVAGREDAILLFGKHKGSKVSALAASRETRGYLMWMLDEGFDDELKRAVLVQLGMDS